MVDGSGLFGSLTGGLTIWHLRKLSDNPWDGGGGYTLMEVGQMTPDQIWTRLCPIRNLEKKVGDRIETMSSVAVAGSLKSDKDGTIRGRAADGTAIKGKIMGKSRARQLMEAKAKEEIESRLEQESKPRRRRRRGKENK